MRVPYPVPGLPFSPFLYFLSLSLAQDSPETIFKLDVFTQQKPCAQGYSHDTGEDATEMPLEVSSGANITTVRVISDLQTDATAG